MESPSNKPNGERVIGHNGKARHSWFDEFKTSLRVGFFLTLRDLRRANIWTTILIIFVMFITFLNLVVIGGILVGLIEGSVVAINTRYSGDLIVSPLRSKTYIENSQDLVKFARGMPWVSDLTTRYIQGAKIEANYKDKLRETDITDSAGSLVAGIDPVAEDRVTGISKKLIEGEYLNVDDFDKILIGADLLFKYTPIDTPSFRTLERVGAGTKVRLIVNGTTREVIIKGVLKSKVGEVDQRIFMVDTQLRQLIGRSDYNVDEIAMRLKPGTDPLFVKKILTEAGFAKVAKLQTSEEAQPKFLNDIKLTFALLGNVIGTIGLAVASITIFIVIFVNAITRRKFIGIMKGIGITATAIQFSYILQAMFYGILGIGLGSAFVFGFLQPFIAAHPINFPFSDGILVATLGGTLWRVGLLLGATIIAGYIPARIVVRQNTLDAILGR